MLTFSWKTLFSTVVRFPLETITGMVFASIGIFTEHKDIPSSILLSVVLLYALFLCGSAVAERYNTKWQWKHWLWNAFAIILAGLSMWNLWSLPEGGFWLFQHFVWVVSVVFCAVMLGFSNKTEDAKTLWQASETTLFAMLAAFFSGGIFFLGMILLYAALENLFGISLPSSLYSDTWFFLTGTVASLSFLSFFPKQEIQNTPLVPSAFGTIFALYILLPLSVGYIVLMYGYTLKIIIEQALPNGFLAGFIAGFSSLILFTIYMLYPLRKSISWVSLFSRVAAFLLVPQGVLMMWSVFIRINEYGVTETRYLGMMLGIWIVITGLLWSVPKLFSIRLPLLVLAGLFTLSTFGIWGAQSVSLHSQANRLLEVLQKYALVENGKVVFPTTTPNYSKEDIELIDNIISYISFQNLQNIPSLSIDSSISNEDMYLQKLRIFLYSHDAKKYDSSKDEDFSTAVDFETSKEFNLQLEIQNYDHLKLITSDYVCVDQKIFLLIENQRLDITEYLQQILKKSNKDAEIFQGENDNLLFLAHISSFSGDQRNNGFVRCNNLSGFVLYTLKK